MTGAGSNQTEPTDSVADGDVVASTRARLGPAGVWLGVLNAASVADERAAARTIETLGYGSLFVGERIGGKDAMAHQALLLGTTDHIVTGTGTANVWARHPAALEGGSALLGATYPGRFIVGIGISHAPMVNLSGQTYDKPLDHMAAYPDAMELAAEEPPAGQRRVPTCWQHCAPACSPWLGSAPTEPIPTSCRRLTPCWPKKPLDPTSCSSPSKRWCWPSTPPMPAASPAGTWRAI